MRTKKRLGLAVVLGTVLTVAIAAPAAAHEIVVEPSGTSHWVGGGPLPEPAQSAPPMFGPFNLPPSHAMGLPHACAATASNPSVVTFLAPPFGSCHHGMP